MTLRQLVKIMFRRSTSFVVFAFLLPNVCSAHPVIAASENGLEKFDDDLVEFEVISGTCVISMCQTWPELTGSVSIFKEALENNDGVLLAMTVEVANWNFSIGNMVFDTFHARVSEDQMQITSLGWSDDEGPYEYKFWDLFDHQFHLEIWDPDIKETTFNGIVYDNVVIQRAVPIPGAIWLLGSALIWTAFMRSSRFGAVGRIINKNQT